jgi:beta-lactamase class A
VGYIGERSHLVGAEEIPNPALRGSDKPNSAYQFVNPLLDCDLGEDYLSKGAIPPFRHELEQYVQAEVSAGNITVGSVYFRDLNNGTMFGVNSSLQFKPASLLKVPIAILILKQAETDPTLLSTTLPYTGADVDFKQHFTPSQQPEAGKSYTVWQYMEYMLRYSDNKATATVFPLVEGIYFDNVFKMLGITINRENAEGAFINARQFGSFFQLLFNASFINADDSEKLLQLLSTSEFTQGLRAGVPKGITVAHKFGEATDAVTGEDELHDCGIVYYPKQPYLLCLSVRGKDFDAMARAIAHISGRVYEHYSSVGDKNVSLYSPSVPTS